MRMSRVLCVSIGCVALMFGGAAPARADGFINPSVGYHFGGDSACPTVSDCQNTKITVGLSIGVMGSVVGFEEDFGYAPDFFGTAPLLDSNVVTLMSNLLIAPTIGPVRPYVVGGFGLIRLTATTGLLGVQVSDSNNIGYDLGGGVMVFFGSHIGVRGDIRGYRSMQDLKVFGVAAPNTKLNFGRAEVGLVVKY